MRTPFATDFPTASSLVFTGCINVIFFTRQTMMLTRLPVATAFSSSIVSHWSDELTIERHSSTCQDSHACLAIAERPRRGVLQLFPSILSVSVRSHPFLLAPLSAQRPVETSSFLAPDFAWVWTVHSPSPILCWWDVKPYSINQPSPVLQRRTVSRLTFELHQHCLLFKMGLRLICFYSHIMYYHLNQLNSSGVCCTAPLWWLHGHITAPYKLSYYYYYFLPTGTSFPGA